MAVLNKLSVIMPFVNEPWAAFTLQSLILELERAEFPWEIISINNWCERVANQVINADPPRTRKELNNFIFKTDDRWGQKMQGLSAVRENTIYVEYKEKLSHWNAKNAGVSASTGDVLFFIDSHCMATQGRLRAMFKCYQENEQQIHGSLHLPLAYLGANAGQSLIYKPVMTPEHGEYHYSFTRYRHADNPYTVPCMSTCGMMISKEIFNNLGGWPRELGIYSGGEHFMNYTMAVLGYNKVIFPGAPLYHEDKEKRGYSSDASDMIRNRFIASYMYGGDVLLELYAHYSKGRPNVKEMYVTEIKDKCRTQRSMIALSQKCHIDYWWKDWAGKLLSINMEPYMSQSLKVLKSVQHTLK